MKYLVLFVLMGGITALANWPALVASLPMISRARTV
jgi:hypothetical protein